MQRLRSYRQNVEQMVSVDIFRGGEGGGTEMKVFFFSNKHLHIFTNFTTIIVLKEKLSNSKKT